MLTIIVETYGRVVAWRGIDPLGPDPDDVFGYGSTVADAVAMLEGIEADLAADAR